MNGIKGSAVSFINMLVKYYLDMKTVAFIILIVGCFASAKSIGQTKAGKAAISKKGNHYEIDVQHMALQIDPSIGGRITALTLNGKNFLTDSSVNDFNYGSTFWFSPQSDWNWPPSAEIDNKPYTAEVKDNELIMVSPPDSKTGMVVTKNFSGNKKDGSYTLKYTITNHSDTLQKVAPWEVTRVHTNGIAFFPMGTGDIRGGLEPLLVKSNGIAWFAYDATTLPTKGDRQIYTDGAEGWIAEVNNGIVLIQKSPDIPEEKAAPKEGEIELYASPVKPGKSYVEIEHQGEFKPLQPGESSTWEVTWFLRKIPGNITPQVGNSSLVAFVRKVIRGNK